jgi:hypothetical protein
MSVSDSVGEFGAKCLRGGALTFEHAVVPFCRVGNPSHPANTDSVATYE